MSACSTEAYPGSEADPTLLFDHILVGQSGSRFEPGPEVQNRASNCQLGYGRELDFRQNLNRNTGILDEMFYKNTEM